MAGAYLLALVMVILPLLEVVLSVWPLRPGDTSWRFGTIGLFSQAVVTPLLGFAALLIVSMQLGHRGIVRALAVSAFALGAILLVAIPVFGLDVVQMRGEVPPEGSRAFDLSSALALVKLVLTAVVCLLLGRGGWTASRVRDAVPPRAPAPLRAPMQTS